MTLRGNRVTSILASARPPSDCGDNGFLQGVAAVILTYNEEPNIARTLDALRRLPEIVVLDSGSTDATCDIAHEYPNVRTVQRRFDRHATQWNFGLTQCGIERPWVLALDADYVFPPALIDEIAGLCADTSVAGYRCSFRYCIYGRPLSAALYTPVVVLFRREAAFYIQQGHTQRAVIAGEIRDLHARIDHDDYKPLSRWLISQQRYASIEAEYLLSTPVARLRLVDRIRLMGWPAPFLVLVYTLLAKRCILDGWTGWLYVLQRVLAEVMIALEIVDRRMRVRSPH